VRLGARHMIGQNTYTIYVDTKLRDNRPVRILNHYCAQARRISVLTYIYNNWNAVRVIAGGVRQDEIGRLRSPTIIIHSHFAIAAVYVVFVERLRRR